MVEIIANEYGWFSLPPAPLNHSMINSQRSLDDKFIFAWDGTNASVFDFSTLTWCEPFACPPCQKNYYGPIVSQNVGGYFVAANTQPASDEGLTRTYLLNTKTGYVKDLINYAGAEGATGGIIKSNYITGYLNTGLIWTPGIFQYRQACFYVKGFEQYIFYVLQWYEGPENVGIMAVDLFSGLPVFQFNNGAAFTQQGEIVNSGLPETFAQASEEYSANPFLAGLTFMKASDVYEAITNATRIDSLADPGTITYGGVAYGCPCYSVDFDSIPIYTIEGFFGSNSDIVSNSYANTQNQGALTLNYIYIIDQNGVQFNYTPLEFVDNSYTIGQYGLGITINPPETIPLVYDHQQMPIYSTHVRSGSIFGYFLEDYSLGWYLGIGQASFNVFNVINYQRLVS
jgi:hypothetical protein